MKYFLVTSFLFCFATLLFGGLKKNDTHSKPGKKSFVILTYNVRNCLGMDNATNYQRVAGIIGKINPHVAALQELDSATTRSGGVVVLNELAKLTGLYPVYAAAIPFQGGKYGVGVLMKEKPLRCKSIPLPGREEQRTLLVVELKRYIIFCTHFSLTEEDQMASAIIINKLFEHSTKPVFLAGDINATPESNLIKNLEKQWIMLNDPQLSTFPADNPVKCIDYIFLLKKYSNAIKALSAHVDDEPLASDHRPGWVQIIQQRRLKN